MAFRTVNDSHRKVRFWILIVLLASTDILPPCKAAGSNQDNAQISALIQDFSSSLVEGEPTIAYFDPENRERIAHDMQELESHKFRRFEITDFEDKDFEYPERDHARVRVRLNWATLHQTVSKNATLHFVRRNGRWYFSDLLSYKFPWIWFLPLLALPIAYAGCGVFMFVHIYGRLWPNLKSRMRWTFLIFVPFSLIFYLRARPWARVAR